MLVEREQIESNVGVVTGSGWQWDRNDSFTYSSISLLKSGTVEDSPEQLEETRAWMLDLLPRLKAVFDPRLSKLLSESEN